MRPITSPGEVTLEQVEQLDLLEPFGTGNLRPVFALLGATVEAHPACGARQAPQAAPFQGRKAV